PAICDQFDLTLPGDGDCDNNGTCDLCEIRAGISLDCNGNGVPDQCESGACCTPTGCIVTSHGACAAQNGYYYGHGTTCPNCGDGVSCTADSCNPADGSCVHAPNNALCDDNNPCTDDSCDAQTGCVHQNNSFQQSCYTGPNGTVGVGVCQAGTQ